MNRCLILIAAAAAGLMAQPVSSYRYTVKGDEKVIEITNVTYEAVNAAFVLRKTTHSKETIGDMGVEAAVTVEAWKIGTDLKQKPLYTVTVPGTESRTVEDEVFVVSRGLEEVAWWSVYRLSTGAHLFDTYTPMITFSWKRDTLAKRYVGLQVAEDDVKDARLKDPQVVGVLTYASEGKVIREALITCADPKQAALRRSFADQTRTLTQTGETSHTVRISFSQNFPSPPAAVAIVVPVVADDLDLAHAPIASRLSHHSLEKVARATDVIFHSTPSPQTR